MVKDAEWSKTLVWKGQRLFLYFLLLLLVPATYYRDKEVVPVGRRLATTAMAVRRTEVDERGDDRYREVLAYLPVTLRTLLEQIPAHITRQVWEIRVRQDRPLSVVTGQGNIFVDKAGRLVADPHAAYRVSRDECHLALQLMTKSSLYVVEDNLRAGFLTLPGGHRVGVAGTAFVEDHQVKAVRQVSQFNIRIAREVPGAASPVLPHLFDASGHLLSTLVISPPACGKTTMIRDIARQLSWGCPGKWRSYRVVIIDERSEIAACWQGTPQNDVGPCTDVLDGYPKPNAAMLAIRSLSPEVLVTDELGAETDAAAVSAAGVAGISVIASIHAATLEDVRRRPGGRQLLAAGVFRRLVTLSQRKGPGSLENVEILQ